MASINDAEMSESHTTIELFGEFISTGLNLLLTQNPILVVEK